MAQRRFHYEQAFEHYLRANRTPYIAVDEAKKSLLPESDDTPPAIKSFDFVVYGADRSLLIDIKGRMFGAQTGRAVSGRRLESWVTEDDLTGLDQWRRLFGHGFEPMIVFMYCLRRQPPDILFEEVFSFTGRWYAMREVALDDYVRSMTVRSPRWRTVHVPTEAFRRISRPFSVRAKRTASPACDRWAPNLS